MRRDKAAGISRKKRNTKLIFIGVIAAVAAAIGYGVYAYVENPPRTQGFGAIGSTHEHSAFMLFIDGEAVDFSQEKYQLQDRYVHFENRDGNTIHNHATRVDIGYLFETLDITFTPECLTTDDGTEYCNDGTNRLKFYVNGRVNSAYDRYIPREGDRILLSYGAESIEEINEQLRTVDELVIGR